MQRLKELYNQEIAPKIMQKFGFKNIMRVPKFKKAVVHCGIGKAREDKKLIEEARQTLTLITGQKPSARIAKKAISGFKLRQNDVVGLQVTLRGERMYDFLEKLIRMVLPRIKDFRGLAESTVDQQGNLNIGIKEQVVFVEIKPEGIEKMHGLQITVVTNTDNREEAKELFALSGIKFSK